MNTNVKKDLKHIFDAIKNTFSLRSSFIILLLSFILFCCFIPNNSDFNAFIKLKNRMQVNLSQNLSLLKSKVFSKLELEQQLAIANSKIMRLEAKLQLEQIELAEYQKFKQEMEIIDSSYQFYTSKIVKIYDTEFENCLYILRSAEKFTENDTVLNGNGVIGIISEVFDNYSSVMLYTDPLFKIPAKGLISDNRYILSGTGQKGVMHLDYVNDSVNEIIEEELISSGEGGLFVAGLKIGNVKLQSGNYLVVKNTNFHVNPFVMVMKTDF